MLPSEVRGIEKPRLFTPSLVELTPETSFGFEVISYARDILEMPLDPWQCEAVVRMGELLPDGRPRFRVVLCLVSRQNGKTLLTKVLTLWWLFKAKAKVVLGLANQRSYAQRSWADVCTIAQNNPTLALQLADHPVKKGTGQESLTTAMGCEYVFAAANRNSGRSLTVHRLICDELREHRNWDAWNAATFAMNAVPDAQAICITNQGDDLGVVLDSLRATALQYIETGIGDPRLGLLEWSAPDGSDPCDLNALAMANPNLGHRIDVDALMGAAMRAKAAGGSELAGFRTEAMCMRVKLLDPAIDPDSWILCAAETPLDLAQHRDRVVLALDISLGGDHGMLVAAALIDGLVHVEVVANWAGFGCTRLIRQELPELVAQIRPRQVGWYPNGPSASLAADLMASKARNWPPRGVELVEIRGEVTATTMGLSEQVSTRALRHPNDPILNAHIASAQRLYRGDSYAFRRQGVDPCNGAYALAAATHLSRLLPPPRPPLAIF